MAALARVLVPVTFRIRIGHAHVDAGMLLVVGGEREVVSC